MTPDAYSRCHLSRSYGSGFFRVACLRRALVNTYIALASGYMFAFALVNSPISKSAHSLQDPSPRFSNMGWRTRSNLILSRGVHERIRPKLISRSAGTRPSMDIRGRRICAQRRAEFQMPYDTVLSYLETRGSESMSYGEIR